MAVEPYWIRFRRPHDSDDTVGKWVVFFRRNFASATELERDRWIQRFRSVVEASRVDEAILRRASLDVGAFFTSADREEMSQVADVLRTEFKLRDGDYSWSADFETDRDWKPNVGPLWILDRIEEAFANREKLIAAGRLKAAEKVLHQHIQPNLKSFRRYVQEQRVVTRKSIVVTPSFQPLDYTLDATLAFVLMPFNEIWSDDVFHLIKQACSDVGLKALRADDIFAPDIVINDIWRMISRAGVVIADITAHNANVFYELGIAHTLGKRVVLLRQKEGAIPPFDVVFWRHLEYGLTPRRAEQFKETLRRILETHRTHPPPKPTTA